MTQTTYLSLDFRRIAKLILSARRRVVYAAPGVDDATASALIEASKRLGEHAASVVIDVSEVVYRLGYETPLGLSLLQESPICLREAPGLRIGCLLVDDQGWLFSPTPLLIESEKQNDEHPNAVRATGEQILALVRAVAPESLVQPPTAQKPASDSPPPASEQARHPTDVPNPPPVNVAPESKPPPPPAPEIGHRIANKERVSAVQEKLEANPPQKFDLSRRVNVFNTALEFVEINLRGCEIQRQTVPIPAKLLVGSAHADTVRQLRTGYKLIEGNKALSGKHLRDRVNRLRKDLTKHIPRMGTVLLKDKRKTFDSKVEEIRKEVTAFQAELETKLQAEIDQSKQRLVEALLPAIKDKPPPELVGQIIGEKPGNDEAKRWLDDELDRIFPKPEQFVKDMKLDCVFKGITYETLRNEEFQDAIQKAYPYVAWGKMFDEFEAARQDS